MLRFGGVSIPQDHLESELGRPVQWARKSREGLHNAQIEALPNSEYVDWKALEEFIEKFGDRVAGLIKHGMVATVEMDIGVPFYERYASSSITVPSSVCRLAGLSGIALTVTYYATSAERTDEE